MHDRFIARQLELDRDSHRLISAVAKQSDMPLIRHSNLVTYAWNRCLDALSCKTAAPGFFMAGSGFDYWFALAVNPSFFGDGPNFRPPFAASESATV